MKFKERFIPNKDLYPGEYIKEIAKKIIENNKKIKIDNLNDSYDELKKLSLQGSMDLIKQDLSQLGVVHDNFLRN